MDFDAAAYSQGVRDYVNKRSLCPYNWAHQYVQRSSWETGWQWAKDNLKQDEFVLNGAL